ncbi:hypothetical protein CMO91_04855 [Candidatus Woesearchaeota archaeon]|nr:hypothetical protein [Candidatus Woesearchaeota archaeon]|tara:strand:- start:291 stop:1103 length:813 start_codon:yes stop_codon:yes gene_type:complete
MLKNKTAHLNIGPSYGGINMDISLLESVGLTSSEAKVYLALLKIGDFTSKGEILKQSGIAPSKVYHVLEKLLAKGLVSTIIKNNVRHFMAAPPSRIKEYVGQKQKQLRQEEATVEKVLPELESLYASFKERATAEVFLGWKGLETVYGSLINDLKKGEKVYVLGASQGADEEKTLRFFKKYGKKCMDQGVLVRMLYNETARPYVKKMRKEGVYHQQRFLFKNTPVEIAVTKGVAAIVMLKQDPLVILIRDKETADSFIAFFNELWKIAKA